MNWRVPASSKRHFIAPEVVQTSSMDCGPASLKCLLEGFRISISYPRLQEACQTDIDGTSINVIERIAVALGLDAEQIMVPSDHLLLSEARALPALVVTRRDHLLHFLVAWRRHGPIVQVMDPAKGRRWVLGRDLIDELHVHEQSVSTAAWRQWAVSGEFLGALNERLAHIGVSQEGRHRLLDDAASDPEWRGLATLDAATRMMQAIVRADGVRAGQEAGQVLPRIVEQARDPSVIPAALIPQVYWTVEPDPSQPDGSRLRFRGAVLVRIRDRAVAAREHETVAPVETVSALPQVLVQAVRERPTRPVKEVIQRVREDGVLSPALVMWGSLVGAGAVLLELMLLRGFLEIGSVLRMPEQRLAAMAALLAFLVALLLLDLAIGGSVLRLGRRLEARLRMALLDKLPRLGDRYFHSRLISDMAQRAHAVPTLRGLPDLGVRLVRSSVQLLLTAVALVWIDPASAPATAVAAALALGIPIASERLLAERDLRKRTHAAAMSRFYLDSLLGLVSARTHGAERSLRRGHEAVVVEWARASVQLLRAGVVLEGAQSLFGFCLAAWLVLGYIERGGNPAGALLFVYWALNLAGLGRELASIVQRYPAHRNILARLLEPLGAANETNPAQLVAPPATPRDACAGAAVAFKAVSAHAAGHGILHDVSFTIDPGEHVAIVGRSGAGKSSLVGMLLGWHTPSSGEVLVDGLRLEGQILGDLRRQTAWVDPAVQLWNRSLFDNLRYGNSEAQIPPLGQVIEGAELESVLEKLPDGLQSLLGEGGALTSGGEGQRVRFGRALARGSVRLAILDEPFRGLDRARRHELLVRARGCWRDATLLCVTHDINETKSFDRVLVLEAGRVVEDGSPIDLANCPGSAYAKLLDAEQALSDAWSGPGWRHWRLDNGSLVEDPRDEVSRWLLRQRSRGL